MITCLISSLSSQLLSNLNFFFVLIGFPSIIAWTDNDSILIIANTEPKNVEIYQISFPTARSKWHQTVDNLYFPTHESIFSVNGNSNIPQSLNICLQGGNELSECCMPPSFSLCHVISLKSPITNQGSFHVVKNFVRCYLTWSFLSKSGLHKQTSWRLYSI